MYCSTFHLSIFARTPIERIVLFSSSILSFIERFQYKSNQIVNKMLNELVWPTDGDWVRKLCAWDEEATKQTSCYFVYCVYDVLCVRAERLIVVRVCNGIHLMLNGVLCSTIYWMNYDMKWVCSGLTWFYHCASTNPMRTHEIVPIAVDSVHLHCSIFAVQSNAIAILLRAVWLFILGLFRAVAQTM